MTDLAAVTKISSIVIGRTIEACASDEDTGVLIGTLLYKVYKPREENAMQSYAVFFKVM